MGFLGGGEQKKQSVWDPNAGDSMLGIDRPAGAAKSETSEGPAPPPVFGSAPTKPKKTSTTTTTLPQSKTANPKTSATGQSKGVAPQLAFGGNSLLGQA